MASSLRKPPKIDMVGIAIFKSAKESFLFDVQGDYQSPDEDYVPINEIVLDLVQKHDLVPGGRGLTNDIEDIARWISEKTGDDIKILEPYEFEEDEITTIGVERTNRDALRRKGEEFGFEFEIGSAASAHTVTLAEISRVHKMLLPYGLWAREIQKWKNDLVKSE